MNKVYNNKFPGYEVFDKRTIIGVPGFYTEVYPCGLYNWTT